MAKVLYIVSMRYSLVLFLRAPYFYLLSWPSMDSPLSSPPACLVSCSPLAFQRHRPIHLLLWDLGIRLHRAKLTRTNFQKYKLIPRTLRVTPQGAVDTKILSYT